MHRRLSITKEHLHNWIIAGKHREIEDVFAAKKGDKPEGCFYGLDINELVSPELVNPLVTTLNDNNDNLTIFNGHLLPRPEARQSESWVQYFNIFKTLLEHNIDLLRQDKNGNTAFMLVDRPMIAELFLPIITSKMTTPKEQQDLIIRALTTSNKNDETFISLQLNKLTHGDKSRTATNNTIYTALNFAIELGINLYTIIAEIMHHKYPAKPLFILLLQYAAIKELISISFFKELCDQKISTGEGAALAFSIRDELAYLQTYTIKLRNLTTTAKLPETPKKATELIILILRYNDDELNALFPEHKLAADNTDDTKAIIFSKAKDKEPEELPNGCCDALLNLLCCRRGRRRT